jgi:hypothetical protein
MLLETLVAHEYVFDTPRSSLISPSDSGTVAVIDGSEYTTFVLGSY